jgi:hypothetical protein
MMKTLVLWTVTIIIKEVPHVNKDSIPITICLLFFMEVNQMSVVETKKYTLNIQTSLSMMADAQNFQM